MKPSLGALLVSFLCLASEGSAQEAEWPVTLSAAAYAGGTLQPGEARAERTLQVDAASALTIVITSRAALDVVLRFPDERLASPRQRDDRVRWYPFAGAEGSQPVVPGAGSGFNTLIRVSRPPPGRYVVRLARLQTKEAAPFLVTLIQDSEVRMGLVTPLRDAPVGGPYFVSAVLLDGSIPIRDAKVIAQVTRTADDPSAPPIAVTELALTDDGTGADGAAGDGVYSGVVAARTTGTHWIAVRAIGTASGGAAFERHAGARFEASEATVTIERVGPGTWQRASGDLRIARLSVPVRLAAPAGSYEVVIALRARNGRRTSGATVVQVGADRRATANVAVEAAVVRLLGVDGPYVLESTDVLEIGERGRVLRARRISVDEMPSNKLSELVHDEK